MKLKKIILQDFLTYEYLEYDFVDRPLLVQGENLTDKNQKSNGSGKSGIQTGIEFAITAQNSRGVRDSELVTYGRKESKIILTIECQQRKEVIEIDWTIKVKGSNKLHVTKNGTGVSFSNVNDGKKFIMDWIAISKEDLFNYFIINNTRFKSFFKSSNKEKIELINRFSDASIIEGLENIDTEDFEAMAGMHRQDIDQRIGGIRAFEELIQKEEDKDIEASVAELEEEQKEEIEDLQDDIESIKEDIEKIDADIYTKEKKIITINNSTKDYDSTIVASEQLIDKKKEELIHAEIKVTKALKVITDFNETDFDQKRDVMEAFVEGLDGDVEKNKTFQREHKVREKKILTMIQNIEHDLQGSVTCPKCDHEFLLGETEEDVPTLKARKIKVQQILDKNTLGLGKLEKALDAIEVDIESEEKDISKLNKEEKKEMDKLADLRDILADMKEEQSDIEIKINSLLNEIQKAELAKSGIGIKVDAVKLEIKKCESDIAENKLKTTRVLNEIREVKKRKCEVQIDQQLIKNTKKQIKELESYKNTSEELLDKTNDAIFKRNVWSNNFKQFKMHLANQSLEAMAYHCNRFLTDMGSDMLVEFEGYKILANGKTKDEITAKVIRDTERSFSSFSGGEQGRLLFASILANRHMINMTHPYGGLDFLSIDEVFEGVDGLGLKHLITPAKELGITMMIITHVTDEYLAEDTLIIVKENGVSTIKN